MTDRRLSSVFTLSVLKKPTPSPPLNLPCMTCTTCTTCTTCMTCSTCPDASVGVYASLRHDLIDSSHTRSHIHSFCCPTTRMGVFDSVRPGKQRGKPVLIYLQIRIPVVKYTFLLFKQVFMTFGMMRIPDYNINRTDFYTLGFVKGTYTFSTQLRIYNIGRTAFQNCIIGALLNADSAFHAFGTNY